MKKNFIILILIISVFTAGFLAAEGTETVDLLKSPDILASGGSYTSVFSPMSDVINPAASATQQRLAFNLNGTGLFGDNTAGGFNGGALNIGTAVPLRFGVITGSAYFLGSDQVTEINSGIQGGIKAGFAKELYPGLLTGAALNAVFGESWALTADLGFIKEEGNVGIMKNLQWGVVLGEFGYSGFNSAGFDYPSVFTPGAGISFDLIDSENIMFGINSDLFLPNTYKNLRFNLGGDLSMFDFAGIHFSSQVDVKELIAGDISALIPSFGLYFNFKTNFSGGDLSERGWARNDIRTSVSAAPFANGLWGASAGVNVELGVIDETAPEIEIDLSDFFEDNDAEPNEAGSEGDNGEKESEGKTVSTKSSSQKQKKAVSEQPAKGRKNQGNIDQGPEGERIVTYISPNNDGVKDYVEIPVKITDSRYIKGFSFIVEDENGSEIKRIENKEKRPENTGGIANFFQRLFYVEKGVDIPEIIRWDGIGDNGETAPDGFYRFYMQAWDDNGNVSETDKYGLVIDNSPPEIEIETPDAEARIFSPNNDGNKDSLGIIQSGSEEDSWSAVIKSSGGKIFKNYKWTEASPESFEWDGKDDKKLLVPDGVYFYYIETVDRAGNRSEAELSNIIINTQSTPIELAVDASYFAPGLEDSTDLISFIPDVPVKTGIRNWSMKIVNSEGRAVKKYSEGNIPEVFEYYGKTDSGYISEGRYKGILEIEYINGNKPIVESPEIIADKTAPSASAKTSLRIFSPNGDGKKDLITFYQETSVEDVWYAEIINDAGESIRKYKWVTNAETSFNWDGYTENGELASDGSYHYRLFTADRAGNTGESGIISFDLDTEETPVILTAHPEAFSPNGDDIKDVLNLTPVLNVTEGIQSYKLLITDSVGNIVKSIESEGRIKDKFVWDGFSDAGRKAEEGVYRAALEVVYEKGDISNAVTRDFSLDTVYPEVEISSNLNLFSPDDDGKKDRLVISQKTSVENLITGYIKDSDGKTVREYNWEGEAENIVWDGTDVNGNKAADGIYSYIISTVDPAGNKTEKAIDLIEIDNRQTTVFVTAGAKGFTPDGDGRDDRIEFSTIATLADGVESWQFRIIQDGEKAVKTFSGEILPEKIIWDGRSDEGRIIEGRFTAEYLVRYLKGNEPVSETKEFILDISAPTTSITAAPRPFSPDNDGVDDELTISIDVDDASRISDWSLDIVDREGNQFTSFSGKGEPAETIFWDGLSNTGELVIAAEDYPYRLTVKDEFGNTAQKYGIIPVDVLVVKEGDKLKIRIANITFAPDSAELRKDDPEIKAKNEYVLGRLSEILEKYSSYNILIEGHAVSVFWEDSSRAEREQQEELLPLSKARAETVKNYLINLGVNGRRMSTEGIGGSKPIVPHSDLENRWKNRRVEFILLK